MTGNKDSGLSLNGIPIIPGEDTVIEKAEKTSEIQHHHRREVRGKSKLAAGHRALGERYTRPKNWDPNKPMGKGSLISHFINLEKESTTPMLLLKETYAKLTKIKSKNHQAMAVIYDAFSNGKWFTTLEAVKEVQKRVPGFKINKKNPGSDISKILGPLNPVTGIGILAMKKDGRVPKYRLTSEAFDLGPIVASQFSIDCKKKGPWDKDPRQFISFLRTQAKSEAAKAELMPYEDAHSGQIKDETAAAGIHTREISNEELAKRLGLPTNINITVKHEIGLSPALEKLLLKLLG